MTHAQAFRSSLLAVLAVSVLACNFLQLFGPAETPTVVASTATATKLHATPSQTVPAPRYVTVVAFDHLYLRSGPGMQYSANDNVLSWGDVLQFENECVTDPVGTQWLRVKFGRNEGWVSQRYITPILCTTK